MGWALGAMFILCIGGALLAGAIAAGGIDDEDDTVED